MVGGADFIKTGEASEKEGLGDAVIGDIIIVSAQVLEIVMMMTMMEVMVVATFMMMRKMALVMPSLGTSSLSVPRC